MRCFCRASRHGTAATFDEARADFESALRVFDQRDWTARKYALWDAGERLPSQKPSSMMRCPCGEMFDSACHSGAGAPSDIRVKSARSLNHIAARIGSASPRTTLPESILSAASVPRSTRPVATFLAALTTNINVGVRRSITSISASVKPFGLSTAQEKAISRAELREACRPISTTSAK